MTTTDEAGAAGWGPDPAPDDPEPEADSAPTSAPEADDRPVSEDDALKELRTGSAEDTDAARAANIAEEVAKRLDSGSHINTLAMFTGAVSVAGGMSVGASGGRSVDGPTRIDGTVYADFVDCYCPPARFAEVTERLGKLGLVVLALPPGTGREAAAINMLAEAIALYGTDGDGELYNIPDGPELADRNWRPPVRGCGYVVILDEQRAVSTADAIDEHWLGAMAAVMTEHASYLVLVTGPPRGRLVTAEMKSSHVVTELGVVDPRVIIDRRVFGPDAEPRDLAELGTRLRRAGVLELLEQLPAPHVAVRLADIVKTDGDLAAEVRALRDPTGQVHRWFSQHAEHDERCFVIAAAILEDAGYLVVSDAAMVLHGMLNPEAQILPGLRFHDSLDSGHPLLEISVPAADESALPPLPRVRFRDSLVRQAVLGYVWTYLDGYRPVLLKWLRRLVTHPDVDVRARAAVSSGVLAWTDSGYALHRYLRSWAGSQTRAVRQAAATGLSVVASKDVLTEPTWRLFETWAAEGGDPPARRRSLTAVGVMSGAVAAQQPERALRLMRTVLARDDWGTLLTVGTSIGSMIEQGQIGAVLTTLLEWSAAQDSSPLVTKALSVFVFVASTPVPSVEDGGGERPPPLLVRGREHHNLLVELWARSLARKPAQVQALAAIHDLLDGCAKRDRAVFVNLRDILVDVARRRGRHQARLAYYLRQWAEDRTESSGLASQILAALPGPE